MYKIILTDDKGNSWAVYRRFSDFWPFDQRVKKIIPSLAAHLPSKEIVRPLVSLMGFKNSQPSAEFLEARRRGLDEYVKSILKTAGGHRTALWNHPEILTFFDIPLVVQPRGSPSMALLKPRPIPLLEWRGEFEKTQKLLEEALHTRERADTTHSRGHDASNHKKHLTRQLNTIRRLIEKLQAALDFYAQEDKTIKDSMLEQMTDDFQKLARLYSRIDDQSYNGLSSSENRESTASSSAGSTSIKISTPIAKTPVRATSSLSSSLLARSSEIFRQQDAQLSELSSQIQKTKEMAVNIGAEVGT